MEMQVRLHKHKTANGANSTTKSIYLNNFISSNIVGHIDILKHQFMTFSNTAYIVFQCRFIICMRKSYNQVILLEFNTY